MSTTERAVLAGGCFWGMQDLIRKRPGVLKTRVGYTGGDVPNATYRNHGTHAEGIEVIFDPSVISYRDMLELFFQIHDPTTLNRQGNDVGMSYRSAIYYTDEAQIAGIADGISTLRTKRSRPIRLIGEPENRARNPASSSRARSASAARQIVARGVAQVARADGELVPRADRQAIVAAIDAVAHLGAQVLGHRALVLDRQVGNAAPRIQPVGRGKGIGRADIQAGRHEPQWSVSGASGGRSSVVKIAPRKAQLPQSRLTRLVCLPCQPSPAACPAPFPAPARCRRTP
jgi:peptide-methionine (S)-S-oxide reductase